MWTSDRKEQIFIGLVIIGGLGLVAILAALGVQFSSDHGAPPIPQPPVTSRLPTAGSHTDGGPTTVTITITASASTTTDVVVPAPPQPPAPAPAPAPGPTVTTTPVSPGVLYNASWGPGATGANDATSLVGGSTVTAPLRSLPSGKLDSYGFGAAINAPVLRSWHKFPYSGNAPENPNVTIWTTASGAVTSSSDVAVLVTVALDNGRTIYIAPDGLSDRWWWGSTSKFLTAAQTIANQIDPGSPARVQVGNWGTAGAYVN